MATGFPCRFHYRIREQWIGWVRSFPISFLSLIKTSGSFKPDVTYNQILLFFFFRRNFFSYHLGRARTNQNYNKKKAFTGTARQFDGIHQKWEMNKILKWKAKKKKKTHRTYLNLRSRTGDFRGCPAVDKSSKNYRRSRERRSCPWPLVPSTGPSLEAQPVKM